MKIIAVRHGQTEGNIHKIIQSRTDGNLTETGIKQAKKTAEMLKNYSFDKIYCSSLGRCKQTLLFIAKNHPDTEIEFSNALIELDKGELEGKSWSALPENFYTAAYMDKRVSKGESWLDLKVRLTSFLNDIYDPRIDTILIVTHEGPLKVLHSILQNTSLGIAVGISYDNAGIYELAMTGKLIEQVQ